MLTPRTYQSQVIEAIRKALNEGMMNPCVSVCTGGGKTLIITELVRAIVAKGKRVMAVTHVKELIGQLEATAIRQGLQPGVYAAGLNRRDTQDLYVIAQIQSAYKKAYDFAIPDVLVIDENHLLPNEDEGMYRTLINAFRVANPKMRVVGLSATPFRMSTGLIYGEGRLFDACVARVGMKELIADGYLTPIVGKSGDSTFSADGLHMRGGDFIASEMEDLMADLVKVNKAVQEVVRQCQGRNQILHFTTGNKHSAMLVEELNKAGESAKMVNGEMSAGLRDSLLADFRARKFRHLVNCALLTTGYDDTGIDAICNYRPTRSPGLLLQIAGRGLRLDPRKTNVLFLDFTDCIAEGQLVLTDRGEVPIESVLITDKVWDGVEFVPHDGVVCKGVKECITYAGLTATPDHQVWTAKGWRSFEECARQKIGIAVTGDAGIPQRQIAGHFGSYRNVEPEEVSACGVHEMRATELEAGVEAGVWQSSLSGLPVGPAGSEVALPPRGCAEAEMPEHEGPSVRKLRRSGHRVPVQERHGRGALDSRESGASSRDGAGSNEQRWALRAGESPVLHADGEHAAFTTVEVDGSSGGVCPEIPGHPLLRRVSAGVLPSGEDGRVDRGTEVRGEARATRPVYDITNAGPRNRFTVSGLLVHNCLSYWGPLDLIEQKVVSRNSVSVGGEAPMKTCPQCSAVVFAGKVKCDCGYVWERKLNHETTASNAAVLSGIREVAVQRTMYTVHSPRDQGKQPMLKVVHYLSGMESVTEFLTIAPEDSAPWARKQLEGWLNGTARKDLPGWSLTMEAGVLKGVKQGKEPMVITSAIEMLPYCQCLASPKKIKVMPSTNNPRYSSVVGRSFE